MAAESLTPDALKRALIDLAQSDRDFFVTLIREVLNSAPPISSKKNSTTEKIIPKYRPKNVEVWRKQFAADRSNITALQEIFQEGPSAEEIIDLIGK